MKPESDKPATRSVRPVPSDARRGDSHARQWAAASALVLVNFVLHKPISDVCDALFARLGRTPYELTMLLAIVALSLAGAILLLRWSRSRGAAALRDLATARRIVAGLLILAGMVTVQRWLLVSNVELVHFPQFGLLAGLLLGAGLVPQSAWAGATAGGMLDEAYQRVVIYRAVPDVYFDWNDVVLNALGAALAVVLIGRAVAPRHARTPRLLLAAALATLAVAWWLAPPHVTAMASFPFWRPALGRALTGRDYHVMSASEGIAALILIWRLVLLGTTAPREKRHLGSGSPSAEEAGHSPSSLSQTAVLSLLLALPLLAGCLPRRPAPPPPPAPMHPFIVTFWCGPPLDELTDARAAEIAAAGFTVVGAPCEGARDGERNRRALAIAARHGLRLWITDPRVDQYFDLRADWTAQLDDAVAEYGSFPALDGYFLVDEPSAGKFDDLGRVVDRLRRSDPQRVPYINLLPNYASPEAFGTPTYREHLERFAAAVDPTLLSFDYYPFKTDGDRDTFFANLDMVRALALRRGIPFLMIVQAMPHGPYRDPTEAELAWQVHHALAFGAHGISYFAYWTPVDVEGAERWNFRHGLVEGGMPTEHFWQAARLNAEARAIAAALDGWRSLAVVDSQGRFGAPLPVGPLRAIDGGPVTVGVFGSESGGVAALVVNQDYRVQTTARLMLAEGAGAPEAFDVGTRQWRPIDAAALDLAPGGALLLRWA